MTQSASISRSFSPMIFFIAALMVALIAYAFRVPIAWMIERWDAPDSYYSHGFLVPFVVAWLVWRDRKELAARRDDRWGLGVLILLWGLFLLIAGGFFSAFFVAGFGLVFTLWGVGGFLFGRRVGLRLWFPALVCAFMIPLPLQIIDDVSFRMKIMAAKMALGLLNIGGITAIDEGSTIYLGDAVVTVGNACSGLRSLISLILLGILFAYLSDLSPWRRAALLLSSVPIALVANVGRVFVLCLIAYNTGGIPKLAHDASGYLIFVLAFAMLYGMVVLLSLGRGKAGRAAPEQSKEETEEPHA